MLVSIIALRGMCLLTHTWVWLLWIIVCRKRYIFFIHAPDAADYEMPMIIDHSGVYVRPEGSPGHFICGASPTSDDVSALVT